MEITNRGVNNAPLTPQAGIEAAASASVDTTAASAAPTVSTYTPSAELVRLLDQARAQPVVRADRVQAAIERLQQGYYHTSTSIAQTAEAVTRCGDC
jgi:hypothetical protein